MVMSPDDLVEFTRRHYAGSTSIESWVCEDVVSAGLSSREQQLLEHIPIRAGQLLLLGLGGGREAIPFSKMGFDVTGVDFIPEMVERSIKNAEKKNVRIRGIVQDISSLDVPDDMYDVIWLSAAMYSCLPTRKRRVQMLQRARRALKPGGYFACEFQWEHRQPFSSTTTKLHQIVAWITMGNRSYERGDMLWGNAEFMHAFSAESDLIAEFSAAGFQVIWLNIPTVSQLRGETLLRKPEE